MIARIFSRLGLIAACSIASFPGFSAEIEVGATDFCPHMCESGGKRGVLVDIITAALSQSGHTIQLRYAPWERVIQGTREGKSLGALSAAKNEAPDFIFPSESLGVQRYCFFALSGSAWRYTGPESLKGQRVGAASGVSLSDLNDWLKDPANKQIFDFVHSKDPTETNFRKLAAGRTTAVVEDELVGLDAASRLKIKAAPVGCLSGEKMYLGLSPAPDVVAQSKVIATAFDNGMAKIRASGELSKILAKYNLTAQKE
jgi:polar amino acid transport system substrate-binding protein